MRKIKLNTEWNRVPVLKRYVVDHETGCWLWMGFRLESGYGHVQVNFRRLGAHRYFYEQMKGPIPAGAILCHTCDNPPCVNPAHLWPGSYKDNLDDMIKKGRQRTVRKLCENDVIAIFKDDRLTKDIASDFKVSSSLVSLIQRGSVARKITSKIGEIRPRRKPGPRPKSETPSASKA